MLRPALVCLALSGIGLTTASCGMVESNPHRFETLADKVADIQLDASGEVPPGNITVPSTLTAAEQHLRPATSAASEPPSRGLRVEVMDPHDLWDARDGLRRTIREESTAVAEAAAPMMARAVVQQVSHRLSGSPASAGRTAQRAIVREVEGRSPAQTVIQPRQLIQLGAYSSEASARSAWTRVSNGAARQALSGLSPMFEQVTVGGRPLTRLKVAAPATAATAICRAVAISDPWCARRT
ncbi:MAG TPA: hypothetical protein VF633_06845 [Brevundimonas sp.]|jgi:hypothetical protein